MSDFVVLSKLEVDAVSLLLNCLWEWEDEFWDNVDSLFEEYDEEKIESFLKTFKQKLNLR